MRIWIDLSNSPHPLLFAPVARRFERLGHEVLVTARNAQTVELARERWPDVEVIGGPSPHARASKGRLVADRVRRLASWARAERPDAAISHNSYAQIVAARALGICWRAHQPVQCNDRPDWPLRRACGGLVSGRIQHKRLGARV